MSAGIEESADDAVITAHQYHRLTGEVAGHVIAFIWQLCFMRQKQPRPSEQPLLFNLVELWIYIHSARHVCHALIDELEEIRVVLQPSGATKGGSVCRHK